MIKLNGSEVRTLHTAPPNTQVEAASWSPDGRSVLFTQGNTEGSIPAGGFGGDTQRAMILNLDTGLVTDLSERVGSGAFAQDWAVDWRR